METSEKCDYCIANNHTMNNCNLKGNHEKERNYLERKGEVFKRETGPSKWRLGALESEFGSSRVILQLKSQEELSSAPVITLEYCSLMKNQATLLVDMGSSVNIIKENALDPWVWISRRRIYNLIGIDVNVANASGEVELMVGGLEISFQVVLGSFPIL